MRRLAGRRCLGLVLVCVLLAQAACGGLLIGGGTRYSAGLNLFSPEQDIALGKASAAEAARGARLLRDERVAT